MVFYDRVEEIKRLALGLGLDPFEVVFETVPSDFMSEVTAYGLPTRPRHWSYGKVYHRQQVHGKMGLSKIYEIVINNNPACAFLLDTNSEIANLLVAAHVLAHADFFKHNVCFAPTDRNMMNVAVEHAHRVDEYIERYGLERVEHLMDIGFALDRHIDPHKGLWRQRYAERSVVEKEAKPLPYADLLGDDKPSVTQHVVGDVLPPHSEKDLLWFLSNYASALEDWERDVLQIIRAESYYFYPQFLTKILNEGWASYWHAEIMAQYKGLSPAETIEYGVMHSHVLDPGGRAAINPYYLGYTLLKDVEKRWDKLHAEGKSALTGRQKLMAIRREEDDVSFLRNYLTQKLVDQMELFIYGPACQHTDPSKKECQHCGEYVINSRKLEDVVAELLAPRYNYGAPHITIESVDKEGALVLRHSANDPETLDLSFAKATMGYVYELWKKEVRLTTFNSVREPLSLRYTSTGFSPG